MNTRNKRIFYILLTVVFIAIEVLIALYVHDNFIRPYFGDMLVVIVLYTFLRIFVPNGVFLLPLYVFLFSIFVEILQYFHIIKILGLENNRFMSILIGGIFDLKDIVCYFFGCGILMIIEIYKKKHL